MDDDDHSSVSEIVNSHHRQHDPNVLDVYPFNRYYFGSEGPIDLKNETVADRVMRMKANYDAYGMRKCVAAVIVVELFKISHLLLLQERNTIYKLPGGRLRPGESDIDGLKRKLSSKLCAGEDGRGPEWEVGERLGMLWRPDFDGLLSPYLPPHLRPKECTKLFLVKLPESGRFNVPENVRLLTVPLFQFRGNEKTYGSIISAVPMWLSKFTFNFIKP